MRGDESCRVTLEVLTRVRGWADGLDVGRLNPEQVRRREAILNAVDMLGEEVFHFLTTCLIDAGTEAHFRVGYLPDLTPSVS